LRGGAYLRSPLESQIGQNIYTDIKFLKDKWGADAIEFHDNNFFVSEKRTVEFAKLISPKTCRGGAWPVLIPWINSAMHRWRRYRKAGCKIIFFGAESGNNDILEQLDKGGTQTGEQIVRFAERLKQV
jgi:anaerobic magnesium-protoporphyrin IX monomethyl ester cyclase